jgi:NAD(P)H-hydrate repair Nnr-like enzyme with NAD(P)H-hydrate dehydratase domain
VHAACGEELAARHGGFGLLARDLLEQVPLTLNDLAAHL